MSDRIPSDVEKLKRVLRILGDLPEWETPFGEALESETPEGGSSYQASAAGGNEEPMELNGVESNRPAGVSVIVKEGMEHVAEHKFLYKRLDEKAKFRPVEFENLEDLMGIFKQVMMKQDGDTVEISEGGNDNATFYTAFCVLVLLKIEQTHAEMKNSREPKLEDNKISKTCLEYLLLAFNKKLSKLGEKVASSKLDLMRSDLMLLLFEMTTGESNLESVPVVPDAWEDLFHASQTDNEDCNLIKSLEQTGSIEVLTDETRRTLKHRLNDILKQKPYSPNVGVKVDEHKVPIKLKEFFESVLRSQCVPTELVERCKELDHLKKIESKSGKNAQNVNSVTENLPRSKISFREKIQKEYIKTKSEQNIELALENDKTALYYKRNFEFFAGNKFLEVLISVCEKRTSLVKLKLNYANLKPSESKGILDSLSFDNCKNIHNSDVFYQIVDELKFVNAALVTASKYEFLTFKQGESLLKLSTEYMAACLVVVLSLAISSTAAPKRESFRGDEENLAIVREIVPYMDKLIKLCGEIFSDILGHLGKKFEAITAWLMISFLHGLSKSQYSVSMDRQNSGKNVASTSKRSFSRSYSFRAGTSSGVLTNAILAVVKHAFTIIPNVVKSSHAYMDGDRVVPHDDAPGSCTLYISALFSQINLTSIMFWLLKVLFKRAVALTPAPTLVTASDSVLKNESSNPVFVSVNNNTGNSSETTSEATLIATSSNDQRADRALAEFSRLAALAQMNEFGFGAAGSSAAETPGATTMTMEADWTQSDSLVQAAPSAEVATGAVEEPPDNNTYRNLPGDSETEDNSSTTGGGNSLFGEDMMVIDETEGEDDEEDEDEDDEDDDDDEEDEEYYDEQQAQAELEAAHGHETFEWTEEDEDEDDDQDDFDDDDDITESQTVVVDDLSELSMVVDMQPGDLAVVLPPDVSVVAESTANNIRAGGANGNSSTSANQGDQRANDLNGQADVELAREDNCDLLSSASKDAGDEAVLGLLFQEDEEAGNDGKANEPARNPDDPKCVIYLDACQLILDLILDNGFEPRSVIASNMAKYMGQQQCSTIAQLMKELSAPLFDLSWKMEYLKSSLTQLAVSILSHKFCTSNESQRLFFKDLGLDWTSKESNWPLNLPTTNLTLLAIVLQEDNSSTSNVACKFWKKVLDSLQDKIVNENTKTPDHATQDDLNAYQFQLLQLVFASLSNESQTDIMTHFVKVFIKCSDVVQTKQNCIFFARLVLIADFLISHFNIVPASLECQIENNLFKSLDRSITSRIPEIAISTFADLGTMSTWQAQREPAENDSDSLKFRDIQSRFYDISQTTTGEKHLSRVPRANKEGINCLLKVCKNIRGGYNAFYESVTKLLRFPEFSKNDLFMELLTFNYAQTLLTRFLSILPPSPKFVENLSLSPELKEKEDLMIFVLDVMWSCRLPSDFYSDYVKEMLEKVDPHSLEVYTMLTDKNKPFFRMAEILDLCHQDLEKSINTQRADTQDFVPSDRVLLIIDAISSRFLTALQIASKEEGFDTFVVESALHLVQNLLEDFQIICRNFMITEIGRFYNWNVNECVREYLHIMLQFNFDSQEFQSITRNSELNVFGECSLETIDSNCSIDLTRHIADWTSRSKCLEPFPDIDAWRENESYNSHAIASEAYASHVMMTHLRASLSEGYAKRTIGCLQHTYLTLAKLFCTMKSLASSAFMERNLSHTLGPLSVRLLAQQMCFFKNLVLASLEESAEKVFKKPCADSPIQEFATLFVLENVYKMTFLIDPGFNKYTASDTVFQICIQALQRLLLVSDSSVVKVLTENLSEKDRNLKRIMGLCANPRLTVNKLKDLFRLVKIVLREIGQNKEDNSLQILLKNCQFDFEDLRPVLETIFPKHPVSEKNVPAVFISNEFFTQIINISKEFASDRFAYFSKNVAGKTLNYLIEVAHELVGNHDYCKYFDKLMTIMLVLATYEQGAGHLKLFKASVDLLPKLIELVVTNSPEQENDSNKSSKSSLIAYNCLVGYICEVMQALKTETSLDSDSEEMSKTLSKKSFASGSLECESSDVTPTIEEQSIEVAERASACESVQSGSAHKLCTFTVTQKEFMNQHWYHCYTCSMHDSVGVCSVCAKLCHKDHDVTYAKFGSFYCDCGAQGETRCKALTSTSIDRFLTEQQSSVSSKRETTLTEIQKRGDKLVSLIKKRQKQNTEGVKHGKGAAYFVEQEIGFKVEHFIDANKTELMKIVNDSKILDSIEMLNNLKDKIDAHLENTSPSNASNRLVKSFHILHGMASKKISTVPNLVSQLASTGETSFENVKMSFSGEQGATMRQLITAHMVRRNALCLMPALSNNPSGTNQVMIVAHDKGLLTCVDITALNKQIEPNKDAPGSETVKKINVDRLAYNTVPITVLSVVSNNLNPGCLAVAGIKDCHVITMTQDYVISNQINISLALDSGNFIIKTLWIPGSQTELAVVTADFVRIYNLAVDLNKPIYYYHLLSGKLRDVAFLIDTAKSAVHAFIMSSQGFIYTQMLDEQSKADDSGGPFYVTNTIVIESNELKMTNGQFGSGGTSVFYSHAMQMLFTSYSNSKSFACSLKKLEELPTSTVLNKLQVITNTSSLCQWKEPEDHPGLILATDQNSGNVAVIFMCPDTFYIQEITVTPARSKSIDSVAFVPMQVCSSAAENVKSTKIIILSDDGSLKIFAANSNLTHFWLSPSFSASNNEIGTWINERKKFKATNLKTRMQTNPISSVGIIEGASSSNEHQFPIDYFENCQVLEDVEFGGNDYLQVYNRKQMKNRLKHARQFLAATKSSPITMEITNENSALVIAGIRVEVGGNQIGNADWTPRYFEIFGRSVFVEPTSSSRWVDLPFTNEECLLSERSVNLTIGNSRDTSSGITIVNSVKVYGKAKNSFSTTTSDPKTKASGTEEPKKNCENDTVSTVFGLRQLHQPSKSSIAQMTGLSAESDFDALLSNSLEMLAIYFTLTNVESKSRPAKEGKELARILATSPLSYNVYSQNKGLLYSICQSKERLHAELDEINLNCVARAFDSSSEQTVQPEAFDQHLDTIRNIAQNRPRNLVKFSNFLTKVLVTNDSNAESTTTGERVSTLVEDIMTIFWSVVEDRCNVKHLVSLINQTKVKNDKLVTSVVEVLFAYAVQDNEFMPQMMTHLVSLLLYHDPEISSVAKSVLIKLARTSKVTTKTSSLLKTPANAPDKTRQQLSINVDQQVPVPNVNESILTEMNESNISNNFQNQEEQVSEMQVQQPLPVDVHPLGMPENFENAEQMTVPQDENVPQSALDALLNAAPLLEIPADADDEAMMELAIALSLQEQPGGSGNQQNPQAMFHGGQEPGDIAMEDPEPTVAMIGTPPPEMAPNVAVEPHVEFVETPDVSNLQGDSTDDTASVGEPDDFDEEESIAATDGSALPGESLPATMGSGAASDDGNSLAGESIQTTTSASSSAYGGEEGSYAASRSLVVTPKTLNVTGSSASIGGSAETGLNSSFLIEDSETSKLADSRVEMLKLMMTYFPQVCNVGGIRAIPFLQVFLSLSLEVEDEKLIAEILDHILAQLKLKPDQNLFSRTFSKEVQVLLLRLLSMYMQKSKSEEVSVLSKMAAQCLYENGVVSYCKEVVIEMLSYWQNSFNPVEAKESSKLLKTQSVRSAPDLHPFFLTNYVMEHRADVFEAYHQLVTEVSLRIPYQVYRILDTSIQPELESIKSQWLNTLSQYMILPSQYVRHQVRKLLQFVCGTKELYRLQRDLYVFKHHFEAIKTVLFASCKTYFADEDDQEDYENSNGTVASLMMTESNNDQEDKFVFPESLNSLNYPVLITIVEHLKQVSEAAASRCYSWFKFCETKPSVILFLMKLTPLADDAIRQYVIELITLASCGAKTTQSIKSKSGVVEKPAKKITSTNSASANQNKDKAVDEDAGVSSPECNEKTSTEFVDELVSNHVSDSEWKSFMKIFFLETNSVPLRWQLHSLLCVFWNQVSDQSRSKLVDIMWDLYDETPVFGKRASQLVDVLGFLTLSGKIPVDRIKKYASKLVVMMKTQNELLKQHPNFELYEKLLKLVEFDGFYLESDACLVCHAKETTSSLIKLSSIKADSRFTTTTQIIKLISPHQISSIICRISDINNSKMVKSMAIYYNKRTVASVVELKNNPQVWHRAKKVQLEAGQSEVKIELGLPVVATNIMMEVCELYENAHAHSEQLQCPRCSSTVMANPGICGNCGENVFQCHKCRQINYDEKDPFLCSSCGFCKYAKFDFTLNAKACLSAIDPIENQDDRKKAIANLNTLLENADNLTRSIQTQRPAFEDLLHRLNDRDSNPEALKSFDSMTAVHGSNATTPTGLAHTSNTFVHREIQAIAKKYYVSKMSFDELSVTAEKIIATRAELFDFDQRNNLITVYSDAFSSGKSQSCSAEDEISSALNLNKKCFGCLVHSSIHCIYLLRAFVSRNDIKHEIGEQILETHLVGSNLRKVCDRVQGLVNGLISQVCRNDEKLTITFCKALLKNISTLTTQNTSSLVGSSELVASKALYDQVALLTGNINISKDTCWMIKLRAVSQLLLKSVKSENKAVISEVVLPCMKAYHTLIQKTSKKQSETSSKKAAEVNHGVNVNVGQFLKGENSFEAWKKDKIAAVQKVPGNLSEMAVKLDGNSWIKATLFHPSSKAVRSVSCNILETLASQSEARCEAILVLLFAYIDESSCVSFGQDLTEVMALVQKLTSKDERKVVLSNQGIPKRIAELILCEIEQFGEKEREIAENIRGVSASWSHDLRQGVRLRCLTELLSGLLDVSEILNSWKAQLIQPILHGYLAIKKLVTQRTKAIDEAQEVLLEMLDLMTTGNSDETKEFMKICLVTLQQFPAEDQLTPIFVFERLCNLIHPEVPDQTPDFSLCLEKDPQQEDFLAGRMQGNPYSCSEPGMGPLMRDVKNKICRDCELVALLEDDNGMELLVNNRIISLSLPVAEVFHKVWLAPERGGSPQNEMEPMRVVYRMRGLMGDATEEFIENLNARSSGDSSSGAETEDDEKEEELYKLASVLAECNGFQIMLNSLNSITDVFASRHLVYVLLKLFSFSVKVRSNRVALASADYDTLNIFLRLLQLVLNMPETASLGASIGRGASSSNNEACTTRNELVEKVLLVMQPILQETQNSKSESGTSLKISGGDLTQLEHFLSCMNIAHIQQNPLLLQNLMTIVPYLTFGDNITAKVNLLVGFFKPYIDFEKYNEDKISNVANATRTEMFVDCFTTMVESVPPSNDGNQLKSFIIKSGILSSCTNYILNLTPDKEYVSDQKGWKEFLARPAVPYVLKLMRVLCKNHEETQVVIGESCVPVLHRLERVASEEQVGTFAENLLETLSENAQVKKVIAGVRKQTREEKKRLAMAMRAKQLETLGLEATAAGRMVKTSSNHTPNFDDIVDETGPVCCICREGYKYHPRSVLGIYVYAKKQPIEPYEVYLAPGGGQRGGAPIGGPGGGRMPAVLPKSQGYTIVSNFTTVHLDCHNNAVRSHRGRDEWDSAKLQNGDVLCNCIMPMWGGSSISDTQFAHSLSKYNTHLQECTGFREPNYHSTVHDCKLLLIKFAEEKSFSEDCGGGARESNARLIPFHLQIALYVLNSTRSATREETLLNQFMQEPADKWVRNAYEIEGVHFYAIMQLLVMKQGSYWDSNKLTFLQRLITCAHLRHFFPTGTQFPVAASATATTGDAPGGSGQTDNYDYKVYKSALMFFTLIDNLVKLIKKQTIASTNKGWSEDLFEFLKQNSNQFLELVDKQFVSQFEEALTAESFEEWCDIVGLLGNVGPENLASFIPKTLKKLSAAESMNPQP